MTKHGSRLWNGDERKLVDGVLNQIIPASADGRIPSAGSLGVADFLADRIGADPGLKELFQQGLTRAKALLDAAGSELDGLDADGRLEIVRQLEQTEPAFFEALLRHTYMGYYSKASVRPHFGLSASPTQPDGYDVPPEDPDEMAALVEPVKKRGRCYRAC